MKDKPFALIGININCHEPRKLKEVMDKARLSFRSFTDTSAGEGLGVISSTWNLLGTPTLFVLDHKGVIRYHRPGIPDLKALDEVLDRLVREAEAAKNELKQTLEF
jgi:hypothetical protein